MIIKNWRYAAALSLLLLAGAALGSCTRDDLGSGNGPAPGAAGEVLGFQIALDPMAGGTSTFEYGSDAENYIDKESLRVLFFDKNDLFSFELSNHPEVPGQLFSGLRIEPIYTQAEDGTVHQWFVHIPVEELSESQLRMLTHEGFKIAIFANWPEDTFRYTDFTGEQADEEAQLNNKHLARHLAHCYPDTSYTNDEVKVSEKTGEQYTIRMSYMPFLGYNPQPILTDNPYELMGVSQQWVRTVYGNNGDATAEAEADIRQKYEPLYENSRGEVLGRFVGSTHEKYSYHKLWYVWNFGGGLNGEQEPGEAIHPYYDASTSEIRQAWITRNRNYGWGGVLQAIAENGNPVSTGVSDVTAYTQNGAIASGEHDGVIFASQGSTDFTVVETPHGYGFMMPRIKNNWNDHTNGVRAILTEITDDQVRNGTNNSDFGYLKIPLAADGMLRIKAAALCGSGGNHRVAIGLHYGDLSSTESTNINRRQTFEICNAADNNSISEVVEFDYTVSITERPQNAHLYALCENANDRVVIYEIEYIKDKHLGDIEREGILASEQPIPMYGIQEFDPIGSYWEPGELFNLSAFNGVSAPGYNYKSVSLLRSVAKVELAVSKAAFPKAPAYLHMRSMNRTARCNPLDVLTPTDLIWHGGKYEGFGQHTTLVGVVDEIENIRTYGPMYSEKRTGTLEEFRSRLAWYFSFWASWGWDWNVDQLGHYIYPSGPYSPRVFNPHINRSDYTQFRLVSEDSEAWHYVLYAPEKHMTDANDPGDLTKTPKCLRVEMRFDDVNDDENIDDNASYRVYFVDNAYQFSNPTPADRYDRDDYENWETAYENNEENLKAFYPILRNHVYRLRVNGINQGDIHFEVVGPEQRDVEIPFN